MVSNRDAAENAGKTVLGRVLDHPGPEALSPGGEHPEKSAVDRNRQSALPALIEMRRPEDEGLQQDSESVISRQRQELPLQIAAKDEFLAESCCYG